MSFFCPTYGIRHFDELEVQCDRCKSISVIPRPSDEECARLIDANVYRRLTIEIDLLKRAKGLFDSHPRSNHRYIILKDYRARVDNPEDDSLLQAEVDADPELKAKLSKSSFSFHARELWVSNKLRKLEQSLSTHILNCSCGGTLSLTDECYGECGRYHLPTRGEADAESTF